MAIYETVLIARQDLSADQAKELVGRYQDVLKKEGGEIGRDEYWGLRNLAYPIKKNRKGHYFLYNHNSPAPALFEMQRQMRISEDVIRILTIRLDEMPTEQTVIMRHSGDGDDFVSDRDDSSSERRYDRPRRTETRDEDAGEEDAGKAPPREEDAGKEDEDDIAKEEPDVAEIASGEASDETQEEEKAE